MELAGQCHRRRGGTSVIPRRELDELRSEWSLDIGVIEKDYVLGWLLAGIAQHPELASTWIFKGGTCLRKCYYETFRFSEDLDFTVINGGPEEPDDLQRIFIGVGEWLREESGLELILDDRAFQRRQNRRGHPTTQGRIAYRGPNETRGVPPKVKFDITADEVLTQPSTLRPIGHDYSDSPLPVNGVAAYPITELFGEKLRALAERCRPRDLYDVVHLHRHPDLLGRASAVRAVLEDKCAHAGIPIPTLESMRATRFRNEIETEWENMLGHQLPRPLPPFAGFWAALDDVFSGMAATSPAIQLPRAELGSLDHTWTAPRAIASWRRRFPLELIRYAGANRMKVEVDYRPERGRIGPRVVEPYSLRRTREGNIVLFVVNDRGLLRTYRVDRIAGARPTTETFTPRYQVEF
jgi:predicted nucleotidyltransferase component of viral defense system